MSRGSSQPHRPRYRDHQRNLLVNFAVPETGAISFPASAEVPAGATRRLGLTMTLQPFTVPGFYPATITIQTNTGPETIPATAVVASVFLPMLAPATITFTDVTPATTLDSSLIVRNRGQHPDRGEQHSRRDPGRGRDPAPRAQIRYWRKCVRRSSARLIDGVAVTFTNNTPTISPGDWAQVEFHLTTRATLAADRHFRILPRIVNERFVVNLLT